MSRRNHYKSSNSSSQSYDPRVNTGARNIGESHRNNTNGTNNTAYPLIPRGPRQGPRSSRGVGDVPSTSRWANLDYDDSSKRDGGSYRRSDCREYITSRHDNGCEFCKNVKVSNPSHYRTQCPLFRQLKKFTSPKSYIDTELKQRDARGYAAAGILLCRRSLEDDGEIELLFAREKRPPSEDNKGGNLLNFLGGKRWKDETEPLDCAVDTFDRETGGCLPKDSIDLMKKGSPVTCWSCDSKYVVYIFEADILDYNIDVELEGLEGDDEEVKDIEWVKRSNLMDTNWAQDEFHVYALDTVNELISCNIMQHLESIFDAGDDEIDQMLSNLQIQNGK